MRMSLLLAAGLALGLGMTGCQSDGDAHKHDADHHEADHHDAGHEHHEEGAHEEHDGEARSGGGEANIASVGFVNTMCPIGKEAIDESLSMEHDGHLVAFCCAGCEEVFAGLDDDSKSEFVQLALEGRELDFDE